MYKNSEQKTSGTKKLGTELVVVQKTITHQNKCS